MTKISKDIGYNKPILDHVFKCKRCGAPLLMFGCGTYDCSNNYKKITNFGIELLKLQEQSK